MFCHRRGVRALARAQIYPFELAIYRAMAEFVEMLSLGVCFVFGRGGAP